MFADVDRSQTQGLSGGSRARQRSGIAATLTALLVLASCSSSGEDVETTLASSPTIPSVTVEASTTTTMSTTIAEPTTSTIVETTTTEPESVVDTVPGTDSVPTDDSLPTETTPLEIPTDTVYSPDSLEGEVEQTVLGFYASFVRCLEQLPNCDVGQAGAFTALDYGVGNTQLIEGWNASGSLARNIETLQYEVVSVDEFSEDKNEALVTVCTSTEVDIFIPAEGDRAEEVTFGEPDSKITRVLVQKLGGVWFMTASDLVEQIFGEGSNLCA